MANYDLGTSRGRIQIDYDGAGVAQAEKSIDGLTSRGAKGGKVGAVALGGMATAAVAVSAGMGLAVNAAANFQQKLSNVKAVSGASAEEMQQLHDKALQLGKDTSFSASEAASAIEELAKAGVKIPDIMNGAADATVALAAAGEVSLPEAATIASNAMNQFGLSAKDLPNVADKIAGAANASAIDVKDFGFSLSQAGATANLAGLSFDDLSVAIAEMGNAGIKGSDAGTSIKSFLSNLIPTTKKQIGLAQELGIITEDGTNRFFDQQGKVRKLADIQQILADATKNLSKEQQLNALNTLFGSDAIRAASILAKNGAKGYNEMSTAIGKVKAADVAKTKMDNLKGSIEQLKGSFETLQIIIGEKLLPVLKFLTDKANDLLGALISIAQSKQTAAFFRGIADSVQRVVKAISPAIGFVRSFISSLTSGGGGGGKGKSFIKDTLDRYSELFNQLKRYAKVIGKIVGDIIAGIRDHWDEIGPPIMQALGQVGNILKMAFEYWKKLFSIFLFFFKVWIKTVQIFWSLFGSTIVKTIVLALKTMIGVIRGALKIIQGILNVIMGILSGDWGRAWKGIQQIFSGAWKIMTTLLKFYLTLWTTILGLAWKLIMMGLQFVWNQIKAFFVMIWGQIVSLIMAAVNGLVSGLSTAWNGIKNTAVTVWNAISGFFQGIIDHIVGIFGAIIGLPGKIYNAFHALPDQMVRIWNSVVSAVQTGINNVVGWVAGLPDRVAGAIGDLSRTLYDKGEEIIAGFFLGAITRFSAVLQWIGGLPGMLASTLGDLGNLLLDAGKALMNGLLNGIKAGFNAVKDFVGGIAGKIAGLKGPIEYDRTVLINNGKALMFGLDQGIKKGLENVYKTVSGVAGTIQKTVATGAQVADLTATMSTNQAMASNPQSWAGAAAPRGKSYDNGNATKNERNTNITINNPPQQTTEAQMFEALGRHDALFGGN